MVDSRGGFRERNFHGLSRYMCLGNQGASGEDQGTLLYPDGSGYGGLVRKAVSPGLYVDRGILDSVCRLQEADCYH